MPLMSPSIYLLVTMYLITMSMPSNHNWLHPTWNQSRNFLANYWLSEYSSSQYVTNCAIGTTPHLLQIEFYKIDIEETMTLL